MIRPGGAEGARQVWGRTQNPTRMSRLTACLPPAFAALLFGVACAQSTAGLTIPARQTFLLGEYADYDYRASLDNRGGEAVTVRLRDKGSTAVAQEIRLAPDASGALAVGAGQEVTIENATDGEAELRVRMSRTVQGMRYVGNDGAELADAPAAEEVPVFTQALAPAEAGPARTRAVATVAAGQRFVLGEGTSADYAATIRNRGAAIDVRVRDRRTGEQTQGFGLAKRGRETVYVRPHEVLTLEHAGEGPTEIAVTFDRAVSGARVEGM